MSARSDNPSHDKSTRIARRYICPLLKNRYSGEYTDFETNEIYLRARSYNPSTGRFSQEDPARDRNNWYSYCDSDPIDRDDPSGMSFLGNLWSGVKNAFNTVVSAVKNVVSAVKTAITSSSSSSKSSGGKVGGGQSTPTIPAIPTPPPSNNNVPGTGPDKKYENIPYPDLSLPENGGLSNWSWPELDSYLKQDLDGPLPAFANLYGIGMFGGGWPVDFTGSNYLDRAFDSSTIIGELIDEQVQKFRLSGAQSLSYQAHGFSGLYEQDSFNDWNILYSLGTFDICWVTCEQQPNGAVGVTVEIIDSYKFLENKGFINDKLGRAAQDKGLLTPYAVRYVYSTTR